MKNLVITLSFISFLASCGSKSSDRTHEWIMMNNESILYELKQRVEEKGNRNSDLLLIANAERIHKEFENLIANSHVFIDSDIEKRLNGIKKRAMEENKSLQYAFQSYENFKSWKESGNLAEKRNQLALLDQSILEFYLQDTGLSEVVFDQIDLIFIPDEVYVPKNQDLSGKLILAATSKRSGSRTQMFVQGDPIEIIEGAGIINVPWSVVKNKESIEALLKVGVNDYPGSIDYKVLD